MRLWLAAAVLGILAALAVGLAAADVASAAPALSVAKAVASKPLLGGTATYTVKLADVTAGRLEFTKGASKITLGADSSLTDLYRAAFEGPVPEIRVDGGTVTVQQRRRFRPFDWRAQSADFTLSTAVPWEIVLRGGMWKLSADLRGLQITGLHVSGGASDIEITLPAPVGTVPVRIAGGASKVKVRRPKNTDARAEVSGGASQLQFDDQRLGAEGGRNVLGTPGYSEATDRYEIRFTGGASQVTIETI